MAARVHARWFPEVHGDRQPHSGAARAKGGLWRHQTVATERSVTGVPLENVRNCGQTKSGPVTPRAGGVPRTLLVAAKRRDSKAQAAWVGLTCGEPARVAPAGRSSAPTFQTAAKPSRRLFEEAG